MDDYNRLIKAVIVGDSGVGKTSLILRLTVNEFREDFISTIGVDFKLRTVKIDNITVKMQLWDTAGQERFRTITRNFFRGSRAAMVVYDITKRSSFEHVNGWLQDFVNSGAEEFAKILVGTKCDQESLREVSFEEGRAKAEELDMEFIETSAKDGSRVEEAFDRLTEQALTILGRHSHGGGGSTYGPPPGISPHPFARQQSTGSCCHRLGPPGNLFHIGSFEDRERIVSASRSLKKVQEVQCGQGDFSDLVKTFGDAVEQGLPLILRDSKRLLLHDVASKLELPNIRRRFGHELVEISRLAELGHSTPPFAKTEMLLEDFFRQSIDLPETEERRRAFYLQQLPIQDYLPTLDACDDIEEHRQQQQQQPHNSSTSSSNSSSNSSKTPDRPLQQGPELLRKALGDELLVTSTLFCGAANIRTSLHFDRGDFALGEEMDEATSSIDNLFLQLSGRKRFELYRPSDHDRLYVRGKKDRKAPHVSQIKDSEDVDTTKFPLFTEARARRFIVDLGPGDSLLVPRWWWHETTALTDGTAVNWWFESITS